MGFKAPAPSMGDVLKPADIVGHLLVIAPIEYQQQIGTDYGPSDAIRVDVAVLTQQRDNGEYGVIYRGALWFNVNLRFGLRKSIPDLIANGDVVLARMGQGEAKKGQDAPFILVDAMSDAQAVAFAEQWLAANPEFVSVAQVAAKQAAEAPPVTPPPAGQPIPGSPQDASRHPATAPSVPPVPGVPANAPAAPAVPSVPTTPAAPAAVPAQPAAAPAAAADLLAALSPDERAQLLAALSQPQG